VKSKLRHIEIKGQKSPVLVATVSRGYRCDPGLWSLNWPSVRSHNGSGCNGLRKHDVFKFFEIENRNRLRNVVFSKDEVVFGESFDGLSVLVGHADGLNDEPGVDSELERLRLVLGEERKRR
jgi:hypothetical protein